MAFKFPSFVNYLWTTANFYKLCVVAKNTTRHSRPICGMHISNITCAWEFGKNNILQYANKLFCTELCKETKSPEKCTPDMINENKLT